MKKIVFFMLIVFGILASSCSKDVSEEKVVKYTDVNGLPNNIYDIYVFGLEKQTMALNVNSRYEFASQRRASCIKYKWKFSENAPVVVSTDYSGKIDDGNATIFVTFTKPGNYIVYCTLSNHDCANNNTTMSKTITVK